jgi:hypothetical protein
MVEINERIRSIVRGMGMGECINERIQIESILREWVKSMNGSNRIYITGMGESMNGSDLYYGSNTNTTIHMIL